MKKAMSSPQWEFSIKNKKRRINNKNLAVEFGTVGSVSLGAIALVSFLWNIIGHRAGTIGWETSFRFAIIFGIILTRVKSREAQEKSIIQKSGT